jgi:hypothetical protein
MSSTQIQLPDEPEHVGSRTSEAEIFLLHHRLHRLCRWLDRDVAAVVGTLLTFGVGTPLVRCAQQARCAVAEVGSPRRVNGVMGSLLMGCWRVMTRCFRGF